MIMRKILSIVLLCWCHMAFAQQTPNWIVAQNVDEFEDYAEGVYIATLVKDGKFSNSITSNASLTVLITFHHKYGVFFNIKEYGKYLANFEGDAYLKAKGDSGKTGTFIMMSGSNGNLFPMRGGGNSSFSDFLDFIEMLKSETNIKCRITNEDKSYLFTINCIGFTKAYNEFLSKNKISTVPFRLRKDIR